MIVDKNSLKEYLKADKEALGIKCKFVPLFGKEIWKFEISLRYYEFYLNRGGKTSNNLLEICKSSLCN